MVAEGALSTDGLSLTCGDRRITHCEPEVTTQFVRMSRDGQRLEEVEPASANGEVVVDDRDGGDGDGTRPVFSRRTSRMQLSPGGKTLRRQVLLRAWYRVCEPPGRGVTDCRPGLRFVCHLMMVLLVLLVLLRRGRAGLSAACWSCQRRSTRTPCHRACTGFVTWPLPISTVQRLSEPATTSWLSQCSRLPLILPSWTNAFSSCNPLEATSPATRDGQPSLRGERG